MSKALRPFRIFLAFQLVVLLIAAMTLDRWGMFRGIVPAQAALIAIGLSVGPVQRASRVAGAVGAAALFALVCTTLALRLSIGGLLGMNEYGWQFLLLMVRVLVVGGFFWQVLLRNGYVLSPAGEPFAGSLLRFRLRHLLVVMSVVALFFVVTGNLGGGAWYGILLVVYMILYGLAYAAMSLLASLLPLEPTRTPGKIVAYLLGILAISLAIAGHSYTSTDSWESAQRTWLEAMVEVAWLSGSLLVLRMVGFRLSKSSTVESGELTAKRPYLRFSLKALFLAFTLIAAWLGWNVSIVQERKRLRALIDDRPIAGRPMAAITQAEGDASASRAVKERIAPHIFEAFSIRNRGGPTVGPRDGGNLSLVRRWLGDEPVFIILLDGDSELQEDVEAAFPEAMIVTRDGVEDEMPPHLEHKPAN